ncbi:Tripartite-type tricarboxylate transporter, receptor component TctC [Variovorax sp. HW608]|uniref:Bug family tripartite tricarboxylate transporter substrate binding protein n=1 Tax=Variovorax sp. HW608 TaxID=1034889 RepID=UPI00081FF0B7|nr:tripartite tricarboxylate transporter substrate binding protein [Variovorax sp. HW608]SCK09839.1 Tripartite-type tricarboxylate transporter, receptor component TctC [Variovorax sp. HW608]
MKNPLRRLFLVAVLASTSIGAAYAQTGNWPSRPIRIVVPAPVGGPYDLTMRPLAQQMSQMLKQPVVIDNRPSAGNIVGTQIGAGAPPDGYTLTMTGMFNTISQSMYSKLSFDIVKSFEHIGAIGEGAQWLVVRSDAGISSFQDLVEQARREAGKINYASSGTGSTGHLVMELLQRATHTQMTHIPYKGGGPALQDVLAGVVSVSVVPPTSVLASVQAGKLKVLATSGATRSPDTPDVPTFAELGYKQLTVTSWVGLSAPKGTPAAVVDKINSTMNSALREPALRKQLEAQGLSVLRTTPQEYAQLVNADTERWGALVRSLNLKAN